MNSWVTREFAKTHRDVIWVERTRGIDHSARVVQIDEYRLRIASTACRKIQRVVDKPVDFDVRFEARSDRREVERAVEVTKDNRSMRVGMDAKQTPQSDASVRGTKQAQLVHAR